MRKGLFFAAAFLAATLAADAPAQTRRASQPTAAGAATPAAQSPRLLASLPASDGVAFIDAKRLLAEVLPRVYANNADELARINSEIDKLRTRTGLDARQFERVAVGTSYGRAASGATTMETVALVQGAFNSASVLTAARAAAPAAPREEKHRGRSVYVFAVNDEARLLGLFNLRVTDLAVAAIDANTVALGKVERVRAAIDAAESGQGRVAAGVAALASRNPNAVVGFGGDVPRDAFAGVQFPSEQLSRNVNSIRQIAGSVSAGGQGYQLESALRTETAAQARSLGETITGLRALAGGLIGFRYQEPRAGLLRGVLEATRVAAQGNEVLVTLDLKQDALEAIIRAF